MRLEDLPDDADHCGECGVELPLDRYWGMRRFCSRACSWRHWYRENYEHTRWKSNHKRRQRLVESKHGRTCQHCDGPMRDEMPADAKWCSPRCRTVAYRRARYGQRVCPTCGNTFQPNEGSQKYCSHACYWRRMKGGAHCPQRRPDGRWRGRGGG